MRPSSPIADDDRFLRRALALAVENVRSGAGGPFGAVVVRAGEVLGEGVNRVTATHDPTAHAEVEAIRAACAATGSFHLLGAVVYTSCEPCPMCLAAAYWARVDRIVFAAGREDAAAAGFSDAEIYDELPRPPQARTIPAERRLAEEADVPFAAWRAAADRIPY